MARAEKVTIAGKASDYAGERMVIQRVVDYLSFEKEFLAENFIADDGSFAFEVDVETTCKLIIQVEGVYADLFVEPGGRYNFTFPALPFNKVRKLFDNQVALEFDRNDGGNNINLLIAQYDAMLEDVSSDLAIDLSYRHSRGPKGYTENRPHLVKAGLVNSQEKDSLSVNSEIENKLTKLDSRINLVFGENVKNPFLADYILYGKAAIHLVSGMDRWKIYFDYLHEKPVQYDHPEYMRFIRVMYANTFEQARADGKHLIVRTVNSQRDPDALIDVLAEERFMDDEAVRKAVILTNLQEVYNIREWSDIAIMQFLNKAEGSERWKDEKAIVQALKRRINFGAKGQEIPDFRMLDYGSEWVNSREWEGKYVYIGFFSDWCRDCHQEMQLLKKLQIKYGKQIEFVSISLDDHFEDFRAFALDNEDFNWTLLYGPSEKRLRDLFMVYSLPEYIMLDPNGKIMEPYTRKPSEGINLVFDRVSRRASEDKRIKVWDD